MTEDRIINAMNNLNDDILIDAMSETPVAVSAGGRRPRLSRRRLVAIVAACLVLGCGAVAYATGLLDSVFDIYRSAESENKMYIIKDGVNYDQVQVILETAYKNEKELKGSIRKDAAKLLKEKQNTEEEVIRDFYQTEGHVSFDSAKEMLDYIGCKGLEVPYFPYDNCKYSVDYSALLNKDDSINKLTIDSCGYYTYDPDENRKIKVKLLGDMCLVPGVVSKDMIAKVGIASYIDDGTNAEELFTTKHGSSGIKGYTIEGKTEHYGIQGCVVKNGFFYRILISCNWADKAEADRIFQTWAESF